jgi:hypothetical protein
VLVFSAILLVSAFALFKAGKITTNKMQLQNAADAAAFSMSTVEARDLNFAAYMNRAIVANEVGIGQFVGLASWAYHFKSFADYLDFYDYTIFAPLTLGSSTGIIKPITTPWRTPAGTTAIKIMSKIANVATIVLHNVNKVYGIAEVGYHTVSIFFALGALNDVIDDNGPPGTKISDFGILSLFAHIATYGVIPPLPGDQWAKAHLPTKKIKKEELDDSAYARLAALIRDSRDPFTAERGWSLPLIPHIGFETPEIPPFWVDAGFIAWESGFHVALDFALERKGGSELRILLPKTGKGKVGQTANWSSADTTGLAIDLDIGGYLRFYVLPEPFRSKIFDASLDAQLGDGELVLFASFGGSEKVDPADCEDANEDIQEANDDGTNDPPLDLHDCSGDAPPGHEVLRTPFLTEIPSKLPTMILSWQT